MKFYSPLRYPGGKTRLADFLSNAIEKNFPENEKIILVEPYAGGAGASLKLLFSGKVDKIIIGQGKVGKKTKKLAKLFKDYFRKELKV